MLQPSSFYISGPFGHAVRDLKISECEPSHARILTTWKSWLPAQDKALHLLASHIDFKSLENFPIS